MLAQLRKLNFIITKKTEKINSSFDNIIINRYGF